MILFGDERTIAQYETEIWGAVLLWNMLLLVSEVKNAPHFDTCGDKKIQYYTLLGHELFLPP